MYFLEGYDEGGNVDLKTKISNASLKIRLLFTKENDRKISKIH